MLNCIAGKIYNTSIFDIFKTKHKGIVIDEFLLQDSKRVDFHRFSPILSADGTVKARDSAPLAEGASLAVMASQSVVNDHELDPLGCFLG